MHRCKQIAIILPDTLQRIGIQSLLIDYFPPVEVESFSAFDAFCVSTASDTFDYYFTSPEVMLLNMDFFLPRRSKTIVLADRGEGEEKGGGMHFLCIRASQEILIEQLQQLLVSTNTGSISGENSKELSMRETAVLQLIVKGITNKEIADKLNISLNTVLSHRKNITAKLGIKTVSGLTFYAIMNGVIAGDDIEL